MEEWGDGEGKPCMAVVKNKLFTQGSLILKLCSLFAISRRAKDLNIISLKCSSRGEAVKSLNKKPKSPLGNE